MLKKTLLTTLVCFPFLANAESLVNNPVIGDIDALINTAELSYNEELMLLSLEDGNEQTDKLYESTDLITGENTRLHATLVDGSKLMVGEDSKMKLTKFLLKDRNSIGELEVVQGAFRLISGQINKGPGGQLVIKTPLATIGIRGTDFWGLQTEESLTLALIDNGVIDVNSVSGSEVTLEDSMTFIVVSEDGTISEVQALPPEVLQEAAKTVSLPE